MIAAAATSDIDKIDATQAEATEVFDISASLAELKEACRASLDFLASIILLDIFAYGYPKRFHAIWQMLCAAALEDKGKPKYAIGIPRGFSKTIILKLYVVWIVLFTERKFVLVVCNTATHANNFIADVANMLDSSAIVRIFGNWRAGFGNDSIDRQDLKKFAFRGRDIVIAAMGSGGSPRGLNIKYVRPDVIIMDDMQNRDEAANPEIAREQLDWMLGTLMMACHPQRCVFIFVGNMYPFEGSILRKLKHSTSWISFITGAILADGTSIWPAHRDIPDLLAELEMLEEQGKPEIFHAEVMNDEEGGTVSGVDVSKIKICPESLVAAHAQGGAIIIDPSGKKKATSDATAIGAFLIFDGIPILWEVIEKRLDPGETIQQATFMAIQYNMQLIVVEDVAYQSTLCYWFEKIWELLGVQGIQVATVSTGGLAKNARIRQWLTKLLSGSNMLHPQVRSAVIYQITQWNPLKTKNVDDIMDVGSYMDEVVAKYPQWLQLMIQAAAEESAQAAHTADLALAF